MAVMLCTTLLILIRYATNRTLPSLGPYRRRRIYVSQMCTWKLERNADEIQQLVDAFYSNDPYYPRRPNPNDPLYKEFSNGYLSAHPKEPRDTIDVGEDFLHVIENERIFVNREFPSR